MRGLIRRLKAFRSERANVTLVVALSAAPILACAAMVVDLGYSMAERASAQQALDAATLAAAISNSTDTTTLKTLTQSVLTANMASSVAKNATLTQFGYDTNSRQVSASAGGTYTTFFAGIVGVQNIPYSVSSTAIRQASGTMEVALVLDNTWSMSVPLDGSQTKLQVLKTAALNLVSTLMTSNNLNFVKIAIVPYADYVNVGTANRSASWMSVAADYSTTTGGSAAVPGGPTTCTTISTKTTTTCTGGTQQTYIASYTDGIPNYATRTVGQTCTTSTVNITPYQSCTQNPAPKAAVAPTTTWYRFYGCALNQVQSGALVMPDPSTPYLGTLTTSQQCLNPIVPLTNTVSTINAAINGLVVNIGSYKPDTYIPGGLIWGVNVLSPVAPFSEGKAYDSANKQPRKTIILMTDGFNTEYLKTNGTLATGTAAQIAVTYQDELKVCNYAKAKNIEIYTIGFGVTDATSLSTLQSCATDASHYFDAKSSASLITAFQTIAGNLSNVRISS